jgi:hypothetical protein
MEFSSLLFLALVLILPPKFTDRRITRLSNRPRGGSSAFFALAGPPSLSSLFLLLQSSWMTWTTARHRTAASSWESARPTRPVRSSCPVTLLILFGC